MLRLPVPIPERVYALGFLRTYADYLGLEGQQLVDELSSRLPHEQASEVRFEAQPVRRRRMGGASVLVVVAVLAVAALVIGLIGFGGSKPYARSSPPPPVRPVSPAPAAAQLAKVTPPATQTSKPKVAKLLLVAAYGRCWLDARRGSPNGRELQVGTLEVRQSLRLRG